MSLETSRRACPHKHQKKLKEIVKVKETLVEIEVEHLIKRTKLLKSKISNESTKRFWSLQKGIKFFYAGKAIRASFYYAGENITDQQKK